MGYDEKLAARFRKALEPSSALSPKRECSAGSASSCRATRAVGVLKNELILGLKADEAAALLSEPHVRPMDFIGKTMRGFLYVGSQALKGDKEVQQWVSRIYGLRSRPSAERWFAKETAATKGARDSH